MPPRSLHKLVLFSSLLLAAVGQSAITRGPYLQLAHEEGVTIVWRTDRPMQSPRVGYSGGELEEVRFCGGDQILARTTEGKERLSKAPEGSVQYEATITGLSPASQYAYTIYEGEEPLTRPGPHHSFKTHPGIGDALPTRVWVVGDSGTGAQHQALVHEAMRQYVATTKRPLDLYLHVGDMAYSSGTDPEFQRNFFGPYRDTLSHTVCWAAMGNHEGKSSNGNTCVGPYYDAYVTPTRGEAGGIPSGKESFYSFDYGNVHFISLDSYDISRKPDGEMAKWLVRDMAATEAKWIIGFWHHPPYTKGTHDSDREKELVEMREHIMPILEEGGVDLVLSGHSHIYERSMLIDGAYQTPTTAKGVVLDDGDGRPAGDGPYLKSERRTPNNGTVAVVTGHGGKLGSNSRGIIPLMRSIVLDHGSMILDIEGDTLTGIMLDLRGVERDRFAIRKNGVIEREVVINPWTPTRETEERTGHGVKGAVRTHQAAERARQSGAKMRPEEMPRRVSYLIPPRAQWNYLAGGEEPETEAWTTWNFDPEEEKWSLGRAGFGYGDGDDETRIGDMKGRYTALFIRREFEIAKGTDLSRLGLGINFDDGFVLYANGRMLFSKQVSKDESGKVTVEPHEATGTEYISLAPFAKFFKEGRNVIALEGHNHKKDSSDLTLDPFLVLDTSE